MEGEATLHCDRPVRATDRFSNAITPSEGGSKTDDKRTLIGAGELRTLTTYMLGMEHGAGEQRDFIFHGDLVRRSLYKPSNHPPNPNIVQEMDCEG